MFVGANTCRELVPILEDRIQKSKYFRIKTMVKDYGIGLDYLIEKEFSRQIDSLNPRNISTFFKCIHKLDKMTSNEAVGSDERVGWALKMTIFFHEYYELIKIMDLEVDDIVTMVCSGLTHCDKSEADYVCIFCQPEIREIMAHPPDFGIPQLDYYSGIKIHYDNDKFDVSDKERLSAFVADMVKRINTKTMFSDIENPRNKVKREFNAMKGK